MLKNIDKKITYCDTDSICSEIEILDISNELGELKKESEVITEIFGCKNYTELKNGQLFRKIKGIPKNAIAINDKKYKFVTMNKAKISLRNSKTAGKFSLKTKQLSNKYDKRFVLKSGETNILKVDEKTIIDTF
jgi:hypothetical protein